jgi:hypothetical protein
MDSRNDEQTELLRNIWNQIKDLDRNLSVRIDHTNQEVASLKQEVTDVRLELGARIDGVKQEVAQLRGDVQEVKLEAKAGRIASQSTFELLARADARQRSDIEELRDRLERVERHVGLPPGR